MLRSVEWSVLCLRGGENGVLSRTDRRARSLLPPCLPPAGVWAATETHQSSLGVRTWFLWPWNIDMVSNMWDVNMISHTDQASFRTPFSHIMRNLLKVNTTSSIGTSTKLVCRVYLMPTFLCSHTSAAYNKNSHISATCHIEPIPPIPCHPSQWSSSLCIIRCLICHQIMSLHQACCMIRPMLQWRGCTSI